MIKYLNEVNVPCHVRNIISLMNTEVRQYWGQDRTWLGDRLGTPGDADKPRLGSIAGACKSSKWAPNSFNAVGKSGLYSRQHAGDHYKVIPKYWPLEWDQPCLDF